jgi:hypothetical protein
MAYSRDLHYLCWQCGYEVLVNLPKRENLDLRLDVRLVHKNKDTHRVVVTLPANR